MIDNLPNECLENIFSFLQIPDRLNTEKVCKRWYNINKRGWKNINRVDLDGDDDNNTRHVILKRCGHYIKELHLTIDEKSLNWIRMVIQLCKLDQIKKIDMTIPEDCESKTESIVDALRNLFSMTSNVETVHIKFNFDFSYFDYLNVMPPEKLRCLTITRQCADDESCNDELGIDVLRFPNLEHLYCEGTLLGELQERSYDGTEFKFQSIDLSFCSIDRSLSEKFKFFTELESLSLVCSPCYMNNEDIRVFADNCLKLKDLCLDGVEGLSHLCFRDIGRMPSLESFDAGLIGIRNTLDIKYLTNVKRLSFHHCECFEDHRGLVQCILNSPNLQSLDLDKVISLNDTFLKDVWNIYESGRRTVPLRIDIDVNPSWPHNRSRKWKIPKHPLLTIFVNYPYDDC